MKLEFDELFVGYPDVVSVEELQSMLNIGRNKAYQLISSGNIKTQKIGRKYIIPKTSVKEFVLRCINDE